jgi:hypothetical protein
VSIGAYTQNHRSQVDDPAVPDAVAEVADGDRAHARPRIHGHAEQVRGRGLVAELRRGEHGRHVAAGGRRTSLMIVGVNRLNAKSGPSKPARPASAQEPCNRASQPHPCRSCKPRQSAWVFPVPALPAHAPHGEVRLPVAERGPHRGGAEALARRAELRVRLEAAHDPHALRGREEARGLREVLHEPEGRARAEHGREALEDEDPRPAGPPADAGHVLDRGGEEAAWGAGVSARSGKASGRR